MIDTEVVLIDLSSIAHPIYHMSASEPDPNHASQAIVARVRALATGHPHAAICCDSGRSFRKDIAASYKAQRPESEAPLHHQITLAKEQLVADGFPVWAVKGFEADDLIATATTRALETEDLTVLIVSADKDLLQLVGPRVRAMSVRDGSILDAEAVLAKFGVPPALMRDYLTLVGDASDNIKGAKGVGPKKAAELLARVGSLDAALAAIAESKGRDVGLPVAVEMALREFQPSVETTRALITLRTDVDLPFHEIAAERVAKEAATFGMEDEMDGSQETVETEASTAVQDARQDSALPDGGENGQRPPQATPIDAPRAQETAIAVRESDIVEPPPAEWERGLDPRSMKDAQVLAKHMYESRLFSAYGTPQAVLSTVMLGRELGLPAMASLRSVHIIEGRHALSASLMVALVLRSGLAEYFEPVSFSETEATYETKRKGARSPVRLTHTFEMAQQAWPKTKADWEKSFIASGWGRVPTDMLVARATSRLARMVYPDLLAGLYTPEELSEIREQVAA